MQQEVCIWPTNDEPYPHPDPGAAPVVTDAELGVMRETMMREAEPPEPEPQEEDAHAGAGGDHPQVKQAQAVVKSFVREMVKGRVVHVLSVHGGTAECMVYLDRKLTTLSLQRAGKDDAKKRAVNLEDIEEIAVGAEAGEAYGLSTDDMCITLVLANSQAIGFYFKDEEERDTFALCLSMFVDGRRTEVERREAKAAGLRAA